MAYDDPEEFTGRDGNVKAEPAAPKLRRGAPHKRKTPPAGIASADGFATLATATSAAEAPPVVVDDEPEQPVEVIAPEVARAELEKAQQELADARAQELDAKNAFVAAEIAEDAALTNWRKLNPPPSFDTVIRDQHVKEQAARLERVASGQPADLQPPAQKHGNSAVDKFAAIRGRAAALGGVPLRSNVIRRTV